MALYAKQVNNLILARFSRKRFIKLFVSAFITGLFALNGMAWMHARAMTHFVEGGNRTGKPEALSFPEKVWTLVAGVNIPRPKIVATPADYGLDYQTRVIRESNESSLEA